MEYRGYAITNDQDSPLKRIEPIGKGSVHLYLRGYYTSIKEAQRAIDIHMTGKEE